MAAAEDMAGDADRRAASRLQRQAMGRDRLIDLVQRRAGAGRDDIGLGVDADPGHAAQVDHDVGRLRKALIGVAAAADRKGQLVILHPVDHHRDRVRGLADRAKRRAQSRADVRRRKIILVVGVRRLQEQHVARGKIRQRRQRRATVHGHRRRRRFGGDGRRRIGVRQFLDAKRMFHAKPLPLRRQQLPPRPKRGYHLKLP